MNPDIRAFFDPDTWILSYLVKDPNSNASAIIDPELDCDLTSSQTQTKSTDQVIWKIESAGLTEDWIIQTRVHADQSSAAPV